LYRFEWTANQTTDATHLKLSGSGGFNYQSMVTTSTNLGAMVACIGASFLVSLPEN